MAIREKIANILEQISEEYHFFYNTEQSVFIHFLRIFYVNDIYLLNLLSKNLSLFQQKNNPQENILENLIQILISSIENQIYTIEKINQCIDYLQNILNQKKCLIQTHVFIINILNSFINIKKMCSENCIPDDSDLIISENRIGRVVKEMERFKRLIWTTNVEKRIIF